MVFGGEHLVFGAPGAFTLLFLELVDPLFLGALGPQDPRLNFVEQNAAGEKTIKTAGPFLHAFDLDTQRPIEEKNAAGRSIHVTAAGTGRAYELLHDILFAHAQADHPLLKRLFLCRTDWKPSH